MKANIICTTVLVENSPQAIPLGAACIADAIKSNPLTKDDCNVSLLSFNLEDKITENIISQKILEELSRTENNSLKIVCFSVFVWNRIILEKVSEILQKEKIICIAGGPEITASKDSITSFDFLITGEGEEKVPFLINTILKNPDKDVKEINELIKNKSNFSDSISLEKLQSPYLNKTIDIKKYGGVLWEISRGCPYKCSYCYESKGNKTIRNFSIQRIEEELKLFAKEKVPQVFVLDPTYNANKERAIQILKLIKKYTPETFYYFEGKAELIDAQMAKLFSEITCSIQIGLQSSNEKVLQLVNRPFDKNKFIKNIGILNKTGVIFGFDLIYGLPGESFASFKNGIDFAISLYPNNLEIFCLSVLPGTDLFDKKEELSLNCQSTPPYHIINTNFISKQEIQLCSNIASACSDFYNDGRAVPWFNTICRLLKIKPSVFFEKFYDYKTETGIKIDCSSHKEIEKYQIDFISKLLKEQHKEKFILLTESLIKFNGALSRTLDTGIGEKVTLNYPAEYLDSQYSTDLDFFIKNIPAKKNTITTFKNSNWADWK